MPIESFEDLQKAVGSLENADDVLGFVSGAIEAEKNRGIKEVNERNREAEKLRKFKKAFENLGYDGSVDLDDYAVDLSEKIKAAGDVGQKDKKLSEAQQKYLDLQRQVKDYQDKLDKVVAEANEEKAKNKRTALEKEIRKYLTTPDGRPKVHAADERIENHILRGVMDFDEKGRLIYKDGDNVKPGNEYFDEYIKKSGAEIVYQRSGSGGEPGGQGGPDTDSLESRRQFLRETKKHTY